MPVTRRNLFVGLGTGAAASLVLPQLTEAFFQSAALPTDSGRLILLGHNENAYGPFPSVEQVMRDALGRANRYVFQPDYETLIDRIARLHGVGKESVMVGMGSTELLRMAADAFTGPGKRLITAHPTFEAIEEYARRVGTEVVRIPLRRDYAHDLEAMLKAADGALNGGLIYIANPNNPTGSVTPASDLTEFVRRVPGRFVLLVDEAYHHFAVGMPGYAPAESAPNLIITRTFSKVYGLAGIRLGYGITTPDLVKQIAPCRLDNNINVVAASCGSVALDDRVAMESAVRKIVADRREFARQAASRKIPLIPSYANFAMMYTAKPAAQLRDLFRGHNIDIGRPFPPMTDYIRVSFGTPDQMQRFWKAWDQIQA